MKDKDSRDVICIHNCAATAVCEPPSSVARAGSVTPTSSYCPSLLEPPAPAVFLLDSKLWLPVGGAHKGVLCRVARLPAGPERSPAKKGCWKKRASEREMAAPSSTVPAASPTNSDVSFFTYVREVVVGTATVMQDAPLAVMTEAAHLVEEVPFVGIVCKTFLAFEQLVDTARSNKDDLGVLLELVEVVVEGVLDRRSDRSGLFAGFRALETHVKKAEEVAKLCNGNRVRDKVKQAVLARKICKDIAAVKDSVESFCAANNLVLGNDLHVSIV